MSLRGVIFDLDGTLVDSRLDFARIRSDLGLPHGQPILEALDVMPPGPELEQSLAILREHELRGAREATLISGVEEFLKDLDRRNLYTGVLTRNSREATTIVLDRFSLGFSPVLTREDVEVAKPDPEGLLRICEGWQAAVDEVLFIGDFLYDLQAGRNAGIRTVLYIPGDEPEYADQADFTIRDFSEAISLVSRLEAGA